MRIWYREEGVMITKPLPYLQKTKRLAIIELTSTPGAVIRIMKNTEFKPEPTNNTVISMHCTQHRNTERNTVSNYVDLTVLEASFERV